jgi:hypothetical protein
MKLKITLALIIAIVLLGACKKENVAIDASIKSSESGQQAKIVLICAPYKNVTGFTDVFNELNAISNCKIMDCAGEEILVSTLYKLVLTNQNNSPYTIISNLAVTPTEQSDIINSAKAWAAANMPAGYFVHYIEYIVNYINGPAAAGIKLKVTYHKCNGIIPPPNG